MTVCLKTNVMNAESLLFEGRLNYMIMDSSGKPKAELCARHISDSFKFLKSFGYA